MPHHDIVIVGAGTAGCIVAARLSEVSTQSVLLLEAGPDHGPEGVPAPLLDAKRPPMRPHVRDQDPRYDWGLKAIASHGRRTPSPQGRVVGGGSAINAALSLRTTPADHDEWVAQGNPGWGWEDCLAAYRELEDDPEGAPAIHGTGGPWPIVRATPEEYGPLQRAFVAAARSRGLADCSDFNAPGAEGVGPIPMNRDGDIRVSAARSYLDPARERENLTIAGDTLVRRVLFEGTKAVAVETEDGQVIHAGQVIVCSGAIQSPALLQRSGIGPADVLAAAGVPVLLDLHVGQNLTDHPVVPLYARRRTGVGSPADFDYMAAVRASSTERPGLFDLQLMMASSFHLQIEGPESPFEQVAGIACLLNKAHSTGEVRIVSDRAANLPIVELNLLDSPIDRRMAGEVVQLGWSLLTAEPLASLLEAPLRLDPKTVADDAALDAALDGLIASAFHYAGTCRMGPAGDARAVVDELGRVHGCEGLSVIDASVMPINPAANTMLPTAMVAERLAFAAVRGELPRATETATSRGAAT